MAWTHALAFAAVRKITRIQVFSPTKRKPRGLCGASRPTYGIEVIPVASARNRKGRANCIGLHRFGGPVIPGRSIEAGRLSCTGEGSVELDKSSVKRIRTFYTSRRHNDALGQQGGALVSAAQKISGTHRAYVAGQPEDLARIPEIQREGAFDKAKADKF